MADSDVLDDDQGRQKQLDESVDSEIRAIIEDEDKRAHFNFAGLGASLFYLSVFIFVGLPIWWRTTTPERWPLPDVSALMVRSQTLTQYYKISVIFLDAADLEQSGFETTRLKQLLQSNHPRRQSFDGALSFVNDWSVRKPMDKEISAWSKAKADLNKSELSMIDVIDSHFATQQDASLNSIIFYVLPRSIKSVQSKLITAGQYRAFYLDLNLMPQPDEESGESPHSLLAEAINQQVEATQGIVEHFYSHQHQSGNSDIDQDIMLLLARNFDFIFDIIYEEDEDGQSPASGGDYLDQRKNRHRQLVADIDQLIERFYTHRFSFSGYFKINFITQVLHYVLPVEFISSRLVKANESNTSSDTERLLPVSSAHSILNNVESRRVEHDNEKSYHLTLYVASSTKKGALKFFNSKSGTKSNLITTPFRGSILILNQEDLKADLFSGFRALMRNFFRLEPSTSPELDQFFTQLEIEAIVHALVQKHILKTLSSLESTEKLLKKVSNMVIERKIAQRMHQSMEDSMRAAELLGDNGDVRRAYEHSWSGYSLSEKAFYDPSLLSLLYFPDDQKYAIYLPLFLPICLPIFTNFRLYAKLWRHLHRNTLSAKFKSE